MNNNTIYLPGKISVKLIEGLPNNIVTGASTAYTIWCGTQLEYNALQTYDNNTVYLIKEETV